jgi:predicted alpha/beta hydrolase family esterase
MARCWRCFARPLLLAFATLGPRAMEAGTCETFGVALSRPSGDVTLIAHTKDDQLASRDASQRTAERIPGARFVSLASGGHLMLGQQKKGREELAKFLAETTDRRAERVAS